MIYGFTKLYVLMPWHLCRSKFALLRSGSLLGSCTIRGVPAEGSGRPQGTGLAGHRGGPRNRRAVSGTDHVGFDRMLTWFTSHGGRRRPHFWQKKGCVENWRFNLVHQVCLFYKLLIKCCKAQVWKFKIAHLFAKFLGPQVSTDYDAGWPPPPPLRCPTSDTDRAEDSSHSTAITRIIPVFGRNSCHFYE